MSIMLEAVRQLADVLKVDEERAVAVWAIARGVDLTVALTRYRTELLLDVIHVQQKINEFASEHAELISMLNGELAQLSAELNEFCRVQGILARVNFVWDNAVPRIEIVPTPPRRHTPRRSEGGVRKYAPRKEGLSAPHMFEGQTFQSALELASALKLDTHGDSAVRVLRRAGLTPAPRPEGGTVWYRVQTASNK